MARATLAPSRETQWSRTSSRRSRNDAPEKRRSFRLTISVRSLFKLLLSGAVAGFLIYSWLGDNGFTKGEQRESRRGAPFSSSARVPTWGNPASLPDHFARHGSDFGARNAAEYAGLAAQFLQRARVEGWPAKIDGQSVLRIYDPRSGAFGAYNPDGTTKTFFKPGNAGYFEHQPGRTVNLKTWR